MRFLNESRRNYLFALDEIINYEKDGIRAEDGMIWFPRVYEDAEENFIHKQVNIENQDKKTFRTIEECEAWFEEHTKDIAMDKMVKVSMLPAERLEPTDEDWELMKEYIPGAKRGTKTKEDFVVFRDHLAFNLLDRDSQRFPPKVLERLKNTIVGKRKLPSHDWPGSKGVIGRYFKSDIETSGIDEGLKALGGHIPSEANRTLQKKIAQQDSGVLWLVGSYYVPKEKTEIINDLDSGLWASSIGFVGGQTKDIEDEKGKKLYEEYILTDFLEAAEGSLVGVESQRGAETKTVNPELEKDEGMKITYAEVIKPYENEHACRLKDPSQYERFARKNCEQKHDGKCIDVIYGIKDGKSEIQSLRYKIKTWSVSAARNHCESRKGIFEAAAKVVSSLAVKKKNKPGGNMKFTVDSVGFSKEIELDEESINTLQADIEDAVQQKVADIESEMKEPTEELTAVKKVFGEEFTAENAKDVKIKADEWEKYHKQLIEDTVRLGCMAGLVSKEKADSKREFLEDLSFEKLLAQHTEYQEAVDKKFELKGILPDNNDDLNPDKKDNKGESEEIIHVPDSAFSIGG